MRAYGTVHVLTFVLIGALVAATAEPQQKKSAAHEQTRFGLEEAVLHPVPLPQAVLTILKDDDEVRSSRCVSEDDQASAISASWFEASQIHLDGPEEVDLLVKAKSGCLFGANIGPFWIFRGTPNGYKLVLNVSALGVDLLRTKTNGLRDVSAGAVAGGEAVSVTFKFYGQKYEQSQAETSAPPKIEFKNTGMGEASDENGVHLGITNFRGSDGSKLTILYEDFGSSEAAKNYLEKQIVKAVKLVEREEKVDPNGKVVGDRAEILLRLDDVKAIPAILRTDGPRFHEFFSSSRESLLQLEKRYMGEGRRAGPD